MSLTLANEGKSRSVTKLRTSKRQEEEEKKGTNISQQKKKKKTTRNKNSSTRLFCVCVLVFFLPDELKIDFFTV